jgi:hypothetical protein
LVSSPVPLNQSSSSIFINQGPPQGGWGKAGQEQGLGFLKDPFGPCYSFQQGHSICLHLLRGVSTSFTEQLKEPEFKPQYLLLQKKKKKKKSM